MHTSAAPFILVALLTLHGSAEPTDSLDGATGHLFKVDMQERSFELLKETEYDLKQAYTKETDRFGAYAVPPDTYKANLEKEIAIMKKTGARLIWCATTPVPNSNKGQYARRQGAAAEFNQAAMEVMRRHPDILVNNLHAVISGSPVFDRWRQQNDVHFYKEEEQRVIGEAVATAVRKALKP